MGTADKAASFSADQYRMFSVMFYGVARCFEVRATSIESAIADLREAYADLGEVLTWGAK